MIITGSRGEYGYIRPVIREIERQEGVEYVIVATNMLLAPEFGYAINNFARDDIEVKYKVDMSMSGYSNSSMSKSIGVFMMSLTDIVNNDRPDIILLAGDRGEQLVGSIVGSHMNVPVAHIQAGELSGNIDGLSRHAITKFSHIHFASNVDSETRLLKMGEQDFRVYNTGAPQIDEFLQYKYLNRSELFKKFHLNSGDNFALIVQHSVTEESGDSEFQMRVTLEAVSDFGMQAILIYPNNDAGSGGVQDAIDSISNPNIHVYRNLERSDYASLMKHAAFIIGNSSSGILEAPTFKLPAINIGRRQIGRFQANNVVNVGWNKSDILKAMHTIIHDEKFKERNAGVINPYGDGNSSKRIVNIMRNISLDKKLLNKELTY